MTPPHRYPLIVDLVTYQEVYLLPKSTRPASLYQFIRVLSIDCSAKYQDRSERDLDKRVVRWPRSIKNCPQKSLPRHCDKSQKEKWEKIEAFCPNSCGQSYKHLTLVNYDSRVVIYERRRCIILATVPNGSGGHHGSHQPPYDLKALKAQAH